VDGGKGEPRLRVRRQARQRCLKARLGAIEVVEELRHRGAHHEDGHRRLLGRQSLPGLQRAHRITGVAGITLRPREVEISSRGAQREAFVIGTLRQRAPQLTLFARSAGNRREGFDDFAVVDWRSGLA
jgi:hypothetical protein